MPKKHHTSTAEQYINSARQLLVDHEMLRVLGQHVGIIAFAVDDLRVIDANARASEISGYPPEELRKLQLTDLIPPRREYLVHPLQEVRHEGVFTLRRKDGEKRNMRFFLFRGEVHDTACLVAGMLEEHPHRD